MSKGAGEGTPGKQNSASRGSETVHVCLETGSSLLGWDTGCGEAGAQAVKTRRWESLPVLLGRQENVQVRPATIPRCSGEGGRVSPELDPGVPWPAPRPHPQPLAREPAAKQTPGCGGEAGQRRLHTGVRRWSQRRLSERMGAEYPHSL